MFCYFSLDLDLIYMLFRIAMGLIVRLLNDYELASSN